MKPIRLLLLISLLVPALPLCAQENGNDLFLSLTRRHESLAGLPTNVSVVTSEQIKTKRARNAAEAVEAELGAAIVQYGTVGQQTSVQLRGMSSEQTLILVDGRRINNVANGGADLSTIPASSIERIEIIRGAASSLYGSSAFGGVVNIITKQPKDSLPLLSAKSSFGSFNTQNYQLSFAVNREKTYSVITGGKTSSMGWRENSDYLNHDFFARLGYRAGAAGNFELTGSVFTGTVGVPYMAYDTLGNPIAPDRFDGALEKKASSPLARQKDGREFVRLDHAIPWESVLVKSSLHVSRDTLRYTDTSFPLWPSDDQYESMTYGGELQFQFSQGFTAGGEWWEERHHQQNNLTATTIMDRSRVNGALYVQHELKSGGFSFIPSLRFDSNSSFGSIASPRLSVVYQAGERVKLSANSGRTWRAPTFNQLYYPLDVYGNQGNPDLRPEEGISSDLGVEYAGKDFGASATLFLADTSNLIQWYPLPVPANIGKSRQTGAEVGLNHRITDGLYQKLAYTYLWAEDFGSHTELPCRPRNTASYNLSYLTPFDLRLGATVRHVGSQLTGKSAVPSLPAYTLLGCDITQRFGDVELWVKADNLGNVKYENQLGYPLPGLTVAGGFNLRFWE